MMKNNELHYNWKTMDLKTFRYIYKFPGKNSEQIGKAVGLQRTTILRQIYALQEVGLIHEMKEGRKKFYYPNKEELLKLIGTSDLETARLWLFAAPNLQYICEGILVNYARSFLRNELKRDSRMSRCVKLCCALIKKNENELLKQKGDNCENS